MIRTFPRFAVTLTIAVSCFVPTVFAQDTGRKFAILAGVKNYDHNKLEPLEFTENDVTVLASVLKRSGYEVHLLTDTTGRVDRSTAPTKKNIEAKLDAVLDRCNRRDLVLVGFAGHGLQFDGKPEAYFCPQDAKPLPDKTDSLISLDRIYKKLDDSGAGVKLLMVDACRNDPQGGRGRGVDAGTLDKAPPKGVYAFYSCAAGERAFEHKQLKHGVFFHFVLEGLQGAAKDSDGDVTFEALALYVRKKVPQKVPELFGDAKQTPTLRATEASGASPVLISLKALAGKLENPPSKVDPTDRKAITDILSVDQQVMDMAVKAGLPVEMQRSFFDYFPEAAVRRWEKESKNSLTAQTLWAVSVSWGVHTPEDQKAGFDLIKDAAEKGHPMAMYCLANCYVEGRGSAVDAAAALSWFIKSANKGYSPAANTLGTAYLQGLGVNADANLAHMYLTKAADDNNVFALGYMSGFELRRGNQSAAQAYYNRGKTQYDGAKKLIADWAKTRAK